MRWAFEISRLWVGGGKGDDIQSRGNILGKSIEVEMSKIYLENRV